MIFFTSESAIFFVGIRILAEGRIHFLSEEGETTVIQASREYKELARNRLDEHTQASMAVSDGRLYIRTASHLWAIGHN